MKKGVKYEMFREMILAFPEATEAMAYGSPIFKIKNKMVARLSEENSETIVIKIDFPLRSSLIDGAPDTFYITPHYAPHPLMLVKLSNVRADDLNYLVEQAWRFVAPKRAVSAFDKLNQVESQ
jgi:hypothetical protein